MPFFESLSRDVIQAARSLAREKSFTLTVLAIFALCLGANVAIFAVVNGVLLKPLPFHDPHQLVLVANAYPKAGVERAGASVPHYLERRAEMKAFVESAAYRSDSLTVGEAGSIERMPSLAVTPSFFRVLGVHAAMGRVFADEEGFYGKHEVAILSDGLWRQRFAADPNVLGKKIRINTNLHTIIGVMPAGFHFLSREAKLWTPLCFNDDDRKPDRRHSNNMTMIARLRPEVSISAAQAELDALNQRVSSSDPFAKLVADAGFRTTIFDLGNDHVAQLRPVLLLLQAGVLFLLLIGMVNLTNLLLVRATARSKEYCVRQALGASRRQLTRLVVTESLLLSFIGGVIGLLLGGAACRGIALLAADRLPIRIEGGLDVTVCAVALGASCLLGLLLAVPVLWHTLHGNLTAALSVESRGGTTTRSVHRIRHTLIVAQIALAFVLLAATGLLGLSFNKVLSVDPGFHPENVLAGSVALPWSKYQKEPERIALVERLIAELQTMPGIKSVGIGTNAPFTGNNSNNAIWVEGYQPPAGESLRAHFTSGVSGNYFETLGIPLREGRYLNSADSRSSTKVCVIDEDVAKRYWPGRSALGQRLSNQPPGEKDRKVFTIVGVVGSVKQNDLADQRGNGAVYFSYGDSAWLSFMIAVRTEQAPSAAATTLRNAVLHGDPELALDEVKTMTARVDESVANRRMPLLLAGIFAGVALLLAAVGIYGVLAYTVAQRQREIGVRMALGAQPGQILAQFLGLGGRLLLLGLPLGLIGAWLAGRAMTSLLFGVTPSNAGVLVGTGLMLGVVAMLACFLPSRRAARISPIAALRSN